MLSDARNELPMVARDEFCGSTHIRFLGYPVPVPKIRYIRGIYTKGFPSGRSSLARRRKGTLGSIPRRDAERGGF